MLDKPIDRATQSVVIVTDFGYSVQSYIERFEEIMFNRPGKCPHCQTAKQMIGHGYYPRKAMSQAQVYRLWIKRWYCKVCKRTLSVLPSFLVCFRQYLLEVIYQVMVARFERRVSWKQVRQSCTQQGCPSDRSVKRWCGSFAGQAVRWWLAVQRQLAQQDAGSPALNPLGEACGGQEVARALLEAAIHLLAWGKTVWDELADYGLDDRLRFMWQWGHGQGLGRLI